MCNMKWKRNQWWNTGWAGFWRFCQQLMLNGASIREAFNIRKSIVWHILHIEDSLSLEQGYWFAWQDCFQLNSPLEGLGYIFKSQGAFRILTDENLKGPIASDMNSITIHLLTHYTPSHAGQCRKQWDVLRIHRKKADILSTEKRLVSLSVSLHVESWRKEIIHVLKISKLYKSV